MKKTKFNKTDLAKVKRLEQEISNNIRGFTPTPVIREFSYPFDKHVSIEIMDKVKEDYKQKGYTSKVEHDNRDNTFYIVLKPKRH